MSYYQLLDDAIGESPASTIDLDQIIHRQRRMVRARRWTAVGMGAAALVAVVASTILLVPKRNTGLDPAVTPTTTVAGTVAGTPEDRARIDNAILAALRRVAPGVTGTVQSGENAGSPGAPGTPSGSGVNGVDRYVGRAPIVVDGLDGALQIRIDRDGEQQFARMQCPEKSCKVTTGPHGEQVQLRQDVIAPPGVKPDNRHVVAQIVSVLRSDGTALSSLLSREAGSKLNSPSNPSPLPLTLEQQRDVLLDPAVTLGTLRAEKAPGGPISQEPTKPAAANPAEVARITTAIFTALRREAPDVTGERVPLPAVADPSWLNMQEGPEPRPWTYTGGENTTNSYWGQGQIRAGGAVGLFAMQIERRDPGLSGNLTCGKPTTRYSCQSGTGPNGERFRVVTNTSPGVDASGRPIVDTERTVEVLRSDGSWLYVHLSGQPSDGRYPLTAQQHKAIAFDHAIALPAAGTK